jgi:hypothetical protein
MDEKCSQKTEEIEKLLSTILDKNEEIESL